MSPHHGCLSRRSWLGSTLAAAASLTLGAAPGRAAAAGRLDPANPTAQALGYTVDGAGRPSPEQRCSGCMHFGGAEGGWGPCAIFQGQHVSPDGWCRAFTGR